MINRVFGRTDTWEDGFKFKYREKIAVVSNASGAGSTLVATSLAYMAAHSDDKDRESVAFVGVADYVRMLKSEEPVVNLYDALGMEQRFSSRSFYDLFSMSEQGAAIRGVLNTDDRINWALPREGVKGPMLQTAVKIINNIPGDIVICDVGSCLGGTDLRDILSEMDEVICVIDPKPSSILAGDERLGIIKQSELRNGEVGYSYLINHMTQGVNRSELRKYLKEKDIVPKLHIDELPLSELHSAEYNCQIPASRKNIAIQMGNLGSSFLHQKNT